MENLTIANEVRTRLEERLSVIDCRLFGSRARGDADPESDMDLYVEVEDGGSEIRGHGVGGRLEDRLEISAGHLPASVQPV